MLGKKKKYRYHLLILPQQKAFRKEGEPVCPGRNPKESLGQKIHQKHKLFQRGNYFNSLLSNKFQGRESRFTGQRPGGGGRWPRGGFGSLRKK